MFTNHNTNDTYEKNVENGGERSDRERERERERERGNITKTRRSRSQMFFKIGVLKNVAIFIRKYLCWSLVLIRNFNTLVSSKYCEIFKSNFSHRKLLAAASVKKLDWYLYQSL